VANTEVVFAGKKLRNPIGVASHASLSTAGIVPEKLADHLMRYVDCGASFLYTPFTNPETEHPKDKLPGWRFQNIRSRFPFAMEGLVVSADAYRIMARLDTTLRAIEILKRAVPDGVVVIANIIGPSADKKGWAEHAKKFEQAGADIIEMNVSCPLPATEAKAVSGYLAEEISEAAGVLLGDSIPLLLPVVEEVVKAVKIPVGVKMSPETGFPRLVGLAESIKKAGVAYISGINSPLTAGPPDIYNGGKGKWPQMEGNAICPALGPWDRFLCYRNVAAITMFVPGIDVAAIGGLVEKEHVIEAMMLGAKITELSSGIFWRGTDFIKESIEFLEHYMDTQGYSTVDDFIGLGIQDFRPVEELDWRLGEVVPEIDDSKCTRCNICAKNICFARTSTIELNEEYCSGCGLCAAICPLKAITMVEKKHKVLLLD